MVGISYSLAIKDSLTVISFPCHLCS